MKKIAHKPSQPQTNPSPLVTRNKWAFPQKKLATKFKMYGKNFPTGEFYNRQMFGVGLQSIQHSLVATARMSTKTTRASFISLQKNPKFWQWKKPFLRISDLEVIW